MRLLFLTANEQLDGGLLQSQMVRPVQAHFGDQAVIINLHRPMATALGPTAFELSTCRSWCRFDSSISGAPSY
jgi:hypothetical protein